MYVVSCGFFYPARFATFAEDPSPIKDDKIKPLLVE